MRARPSGTGCSRSAVVPGAREPPGAGSTSARPSGGDEGSAARCTGRDADRERGDQRRRGRDGQRAAGTPRARLALGRHRGRRRTLDDDRRQRTVRISGAAGRTIHADRVQGRTRQRDIRPAQPRPAGHADSTGRRTETGRPAGDGARRRDYRNRGRRTWRSGPEHACSRAAIRDAGRTADAAAGRKRSDRRSRHLSHLRPAAWRLSRVRDAPQRRRASRRRAADGAAVADAEGGDRRAAEPRARCKRSPSDLRS